jgi:hypothetical protein
VRKGDIDDRSTREDGDGKASQRKAETACWRESAAVVGEVHLICMPTRGFHEQVAGHPPV